MFFDQPLTTVDPHFRPASLILKKYEEELAEKNNVQKIKVYIEAEKINLSEFEFYLPDTQDPLFQYSLKIIERLIKAYLYSFGGHIVYISGSEDLYQSMKKIYSKDGERAFDMAFMEELYGKNFQVISGKPQEEYFEQHSISCASGKNYQRRVGLDLGGGSIKVATINDKEIIFTKRYDWKPQEKESCEYHFDTLVDVIKESTEKLDPFDFLGISTASIIVNQEVKNSASIFKSVSQEQRVGFFQDLAKKFDVEFVVLNDGDVAAFSKGDGLNTLSLSLGTDLGMGYIGNHKVGTWINEGGFIPLEFSETHQHAFSDDYGTGGALFSEQIMPYLVKKHDIADLSRISPKDMAYRVIQLSEDGDLKAKKVFQEIGVYLGYTIPFLARLYKIERVILSGGLTLHSTGEIMKKSAEQVLRSEFSDTCAGIEIILPEDKDRAFNQAITAANLCEYV